MESGLELLRASGTDDAGSVRSLGWNRLFSVPLCTDVLIKRFGGRFLKRIEDEKSQSAVCSFEDG